MKMGWKWMILVFDIFIVGDKNGMGQGCHHVLWHVFPHVLPYVLLGLNGRCSHVLGYGRDYGGGR
ncbi:MAG: hypothetical protein VW446_07820, partial [Alphaproteobacteria bacterium]